MQASAEFEKAIEAHLQGVAAKDALFAVTLKKPGKSIKDCATYIMNTVRKSGRSVVPDDEVYGMAIHYYDEDAIDIGGPISAKVSTGAAPKVAASPKKPTKPEKKELPSLFS